MQHDSPPIAPSEPCTRWQRRPRLAALILAVLAGFACLLVAPRMTLAQGSGIRLFERLPYDVIVGNDGSEQEVELLLDLPERVMPKDVDPRARLNVRFLDTGEEFSALWRNIAEVRFFEQMVLAEANALVAAGRFDEVFDYFEFLQQDAYRNTPGLDESIDNYLLSESRAWRDKGVPETSLALLNAVYARNPAHDSLSAAYGEVIDVLVAARVESEEYALARLMLAQLSGRFPRHPVVQVWEARLQAVATKMLAEARTQLDRGSFREAHTLVNQAAAIWPGHAEAIQLLSEVQSKYRQISVGVTAPWKPSGDSRLDDWGGRRSGRLLSRSLLEFTGVGPQGGQYDCPLGEFSKEDLGRRLHFQLRPGIRTSPANADFTGYDVARRLVNLASPGGSEFLPEWGLLFSAVEVRDVYEVSVELRWSHVLPDGLLQVAPVTSAESSVGDVAHSIDPYTMLEQSDDRVYFAANPEYFAREAGQPDEIVERLFTSRDEAASALIAGKVDMVDRLNPWEVGALEASSEIVVESYAVPTVHCLLVNYDKPDLRSRTFRRALVYGIDRETILRRHLLRKQKMEGCRVVSGPIPAGLRIQDPLQYAYNEALLPRPFDPRLAMVLANLAARESESAGEEDSADVADPPNSRRSEIGSAVSRPLVLAHTADDVARVACKAIQKYLAAITIPITLHELEPGEITRPTDEYDLVYAELSMHEPIVEVRGLLGPGGVAGDCSPNMSLALRRLDHVAGWTEARERLHDIHRTAYDETVVIPLWQLKEHFAYRRGLEGMGSQPVVLYQNVEAWRNEHVATASRP